MTLEITLGDFKEVQTPAGSWLRFAVTVTGDGEPLWTQSGFVVDRDWRVRPPMTRTKFGRGAQRFTQITPRFEEMLLNAIERVPDVESVLGPRRKEEGRKLEGQVKLSTPG